LADNENNERENGGSSFRSDGGAPRSRDRGPARQGGGAPGRGGGFRRDFRRRAKICQFCVEKDRVIDYKDVSLLRQYVAEGGRIYSRRKTGTCAKHQRLLSQAIKRARQIALLPYTAGHFR
jgi:small subunit ribosomal protein S18